MRILYFTAETCPTFRADVAVLFGKYLPGLGIRSDIVAAQSQDSPGKVGWGGGETILCRPGRGAMRLRLVSFLHALRQLVSADARRYDAIQIRDMPVVATFAWLACRLKGIPFYYWMSYPMPDGQIDLARSRGLSAGWMKFLYPWISGHVGHWLLYHWVLRRADHAFVQSDRMKQDLQAKGIAPHRMTPVPMGVDLPEVEALIPEDEPGAEADGAPRLVYLGTLDRPRQIERLFAMLAKVRAEMPDVVLWLVGDTEDAVHRAALEAAAQAAGVWDAVVWVGWVPTRQAWHLVRSGAVALSPFPRGPLLDSASPTKVAEYLALGIPVVCNDNPDQAEIISGSGAGRCVEYTAEAFAAAVMSVLRMPLEQRKAMGARGRDYIRQHRDYRLLAAHVADTYRRLLPRRPV